MQRMFKTVAKFMGLVVQGIRGARRAAVICARAGSGRGRTEPGATGPNRPKALIEPGPRPGLDLGVPGLRLGPGRFEVFEPGVRLFDLK